MPAIKSFATDFSAKLASNTANADGGIICDPVVLRLDEDRFWLSGADADIHLWCQGLALSGDYDVEVSVPDQIAVTSSPPTSVPKV